MARNFSTLTSFSWHEISSLTVDNCGTVIEIICGILIEIPYGTPIEMGTYAIGMPYRVM